MFLPLFFESEGLSCLVVGGGEVAARKVDTLCGLGCRVTVISPEIHELIKGIAAAGGIEWIARGYQSGDCGGFGLVIVATPHREVNREVSVEARSLGIPVNVVDDPELCTVIFPAVHRDGPLTLAVSTGGTAPFMAAAVRDRLAERSEGMGAWVEAAGRFREAVRRAAKDPAEKNRLYQEFLAASARRHAKESPQSAELSDWLDWLGQIG